MQAICVHGHFYQLPRANPRLEATKYQESAYRYHHWNEQVAAESYAPNTTARILDAKDRITQIANDDSLIGVNFGPTLLSWTAEKVPKFTRLSAWRFALALHAGPDTPEVAR